MVGAIIFIIFKDFSVCGQMIFTIIFAVNFLRVDVHTYARYAL